MASAAAGTVKARVARECGQRPGGREAGDGAACAAGRGAHPVRPGGANGRAASVIKAEWGTKRTCPKCGTRFYDLGQDDPVTCINCGHMWVPEPILKSKQSLPFAEAKAEGAAGEAEEAVELDAADLETLEPEEGEPADDADVDIVADDNDFSEVVVEDKEEDQ